MKRSMLQLVTFPEVNQVIAKDQPEYLPLPAHRRANSPEGEIVFCWALSWPQRLKVLLTGKLWHSVWTFNNSLQPQRVEVDKPEMVEK